MTSFTSFMALGALLSAIFISAPQVQAKDLTIIMSPVMQQEQLQRDVSRSLALVLDQVQPGERALFIDGQHIKVITEFVVPDKKAYSHHKAKLQTNKVALAQLKRFSDNAIPVPEHGVTGAIKLPQVLEFLGKNYPHSKGSDIIILGSPIYHDLSNDDWSMTDNRYAEDRLFNEDAAQSLFSVQGKAAWLKDARIHWFTRDDAWQSSSQYAYRITRMMTLFIEGHGASLSTFSSDWATVTTRASGAKALPHSFDKIALPAMQLPPPPRRTIMARGMTAQEFAQAQQAKETKKDIPTSDTHLPIFERAVMASAPSSSILTTPAKVEIGISWDCINCDLDLHVRPYKGAEVLSFSNKQSDDGVYHKDFTSSPSTINGYETASFTSDIVPADMLIAINWYGGAHNATIKGELRMAVGNATYSLPFTFDAGKGNGGKDIRTALNDGIAANDKWLIIDPKDILKP